MKTQEMKTQEMAGWLNPLHVSFREKYPFLSNKPKRQHIYTYLSKIYIFPNSTATKMGIYDRHFQPKMNEISRF